MQTSQREAATAAVDQRAHRQPSHACTLAPRDGRCPIAHWPGLPMMALKLLGVLCARAAASCPSCLLSTRCSYTSWRPSSGTRSPPLLCHPFIPYSSPSLLGRILTRGVLLGAPRCCRAGSLCLRRMVRCSSGPGGTPQVRPNPGGKLIQRKGHYKVCNNAAPPLPGG